MTVLRHLVSVTSRRLPSSSATRHPPVRKSWIILTALLAAAGAAVWIGGWIGDLGQLHSRASKSLEPPISRSLGISRTSDSAGNSFGDPSAASSEIAPGPIHFTEMTRDSGVDFRHISGDSAEKPSRQRMAASRRSIDLDGYDLYFLTGTGFPSIALDPPGELLHVLGIISAMSPGRRAG